MLALFGGSFDPPQLGHIKSVVYAASEIGIQQVNLLPCARSPLKKATGANDEQRMSMLLLFCEAWNKEPSRVKLVVDETELALAPPSYTVDTLRLIRASTPAPQPLIFFLGEDSLYTLNKWKEWTALSDFCHLVVMRRQIENIQIDTELADWIDSRITDETAHLRTRPCGLIYLCKSPLVTISSTELRAKLAVNSKDVSEWMPEYIVQYIKTQHLYETK